MANPRNAQGIGNPNMGWCRYAQARATTSPISILLVIIAHIRAVHHISGTIWEESHTQPIPATTPRGRAMRNRFFGWKWCAIKRKLEIKTSLNWVLVSSSLDRDHLQVPALEVLLVFFALLSWLDLPFSLSLAFFRSLEGSQAKE